MFTIRGRYKDALAKTVKPVSTILLMAHQNYPNNCHRFASGCIKGKVPIKVYKVPITVPIRVRKLAE
jgi:hypothetical protein